MTHVEEHTVELVLDRGHWVGMTLYPETKCTPARAIDILEIYGNERLWMNSARDWGVSDPLAVPKAALEMKRRGHLADAIGKVIYENPRRFQPVPQVQAAESVKPFSPYPTKIFRADFFTASASSRGLSTTPSPPQLKTQRSISPKLTAIPVAVITNGTLFHRQDVRDELSHADLVVPSLDAVSEDVFRAVNQPHPLIRLSEMLSGLSHFRELFGGQLWLEIMLVKGGQ